MPRASLPPNQRPRALVQSLVHSSEIPQKIIDAAAETFSVHGFKGTRVRDIVRLADVNLAAVNYYFGGKEGLYAATIADLSSGRQVLRPRDDFEADPIGLLRSHVAVLLRRAMEGGRNTRLSRILAHESMEPTAYFDKVIPTIVGPEFERLVQLVRRIAVPELTDSEAVDLALSIMGQCYFYLFAGPAVRVFRKGQLPDDIDVLADKVTKFSVGAIRAARV